MVARRGRPAIGPGAPMDIPCVRSAWHLEPPFTPLIGGRASVLRDGGWGCRRMDTL
jgi:hypothetical protein